jgi:beta-syntrophin
MYNSIQRQRMPALRREEPTNFNAVLVLVQQQWMKALLALEDDVLVLNFENTYAFDDEYGDHGNRPRPDQEAFHTGGDSLTGQKRIVKIVKDADTGLGISIKGGRENRMPVVISKIFEGMAADKTNQLHCGDAILSCNGFDLSNASHDDCVAALRRAGSVVILEGLAFLQYRLK